MKQYEVWWANLPAPAGRKPVMLLSRYSAYEYLNKFVVAEITSTVRGTAQEVNDGRAAVGTTADDRALAQLQLAIAARIAAGHIRGEWPDIQRDGEVRLRGVGRDLRAGPRHLLLNGGQHRHLR